MSAWMTKEIVVQPKGSSGATEDGLAPGVQVFGARFSSLDAGLNSEAFERGSCSGDKRPRDGFSTNKRTAVNIRPIKKANDHTKFAT